MNAALGARFLPEDFLLAARFGAFFLVLRFADLRAVFFFAVFLLVVAIAISSVMRAVCASEPAELPFRTVYRQRPVAIGKFDFLL
jgi:hypothetical protein